MAQRKNETSKLALKVITAVGTGGVKTYATRTVTHFNPNVSDDDAVTLGTQLAGLQEYDLDSLSRTDTAEIEEED